MELICRIIKQYPLQQRQYTDKTGQPQTFTSVGFELASGTDTLFAELTGEQAVKCGTHDTAYYYKADLSSRSEAWTDAQGAERHATRMYINKISVL